MDKITAIVLTKNDEEKIVDCLESFSEFEEIIVVDDFSKDRTVDVIKSLPFSTKIKVFKNSLNDNFSQQRNFALSKSNNEWVLFVDSDEVVAKELFEEIGKAINLDKDGFYIKRRDFMWGKELKHGETGSIRLVRLGKKNSGAWKGKVHEVWEIRGKIGVLKNSIYHYPHKTVREFIEEIDFYSTLRAEELSAKGASASFLSIIVYTKGKFILNYILKLGFLDGLPGFVVAILMSFHSFMVRSKLWLKNNGNE